MQLISRMIKLIFVLGLLAATIYYRAIYGAMDVDSQKILRFCMDNFTHGQHDERVECIAVLVNCAYRTKTAQADACIQKYPLLVREAEQKLKEVTYGY